ncbi:MAG TPA: D-alanine--D-alanine ligase, partial [bacterium]|nr:D-alanine--D-alanine ligase [bacterium]
MKMVRTLGLVLETRADAEAYAAGHALDLERLYHYREPEELAAITQALTALGYAVELLGTPAQALATHDQWRARIDFIVNLSVGFVSRFRLALGPALFELTGIPYWGADPCGKMVSQHKPLQKALMDKLGIPTPAWAYVDTPAALDAMPDLRWPRIVKPAYEGSSIAVPAGAKVKNEHELRARAMLLLEQYRLPLIVEEFIAGREFKAGMIGDRGQRWQGLIEDVRADGSPLGDAFLAYGVKKEGVLGKAARDASAPEYAALMADCRRLYELLMPLDYATFDLRVDDAGRHYILEGNADATLHPARTLAQCCARNGLDYRG